HDGSGREGLNTADNGLGDGLGGRAGKHDLAGFRTGHARDALPAGLDEVAECPAMTMDGGRIAGELERGKQRRPRLGTKRGRGIMIKIDRRSRHLTFKGRLRVRHTSHARPGTLPARENQTLLEISSPTSLQGALQLAETRPETRFEQF